MAADAGSAGAGALTAYLCGALLRRRMPLYALWRSRLDMFALLHKSCNACHDSWSNLARVHP